MNKREDEHFMALALREAKRGAGRTSPNPCVGAVIVKNGRIIGKGYHKKAGAPHAEINALGQASEPVYGSTLYVTLEPCNHTGRTPPCTHAIIAGGISRVVIGMSDPNPLVNGTGIAFLKGRGVSVTCGVLEKECEEINASFIKYITTGVPLVIMKAGVSLDGRLSYLKKHSGWITGAESVREAHKLRDKVDAVVVGGRTIVIDNPLLTTRLPGRMTKNPVRIVLDSQLTTPLQAKVYARDSEALTWVFHAKDAPAGRIAEFMAQGVRLFAVERLAQGLNLHEILKKIGKEGLCSILVEGGARLHGSLLQQRLYDYAYLFYAPIFAGDKGVGLAEGLEVKGLDAAPRLHAARYRRLGEDIMVSGRLNYPE